MVNSVDTKPRRDLQSSENSKNERANAANSSTNTSDTEMDRTYSNQANLNTQGKGYKAHVASNISSSMSGNVVGDMVGDKRMGLLDAMREAEPQIGRRPTPASDSWPARKKLLIGIGLGLLVCIIVAILVVVLAQQSDMAPQLVN